jgi:hypothetical protein
MIFSYDAPLHKELTSHRFDVAILADLITD